MQKKSQSLPASIIASLRQRKNRPGHPARPAAGEQRSGTLVASYNVHKCVGVDGRFDPTRIAQVIREIAPDIIALQEADKRFGARHGLLDLARLKDETGLVPVPVESANAAAHGWHGNVVLIRQGLVRDVHQVSLPGLEPRGALVVDIDLESGAELRIVAAHLGLLRRSRSQQARMLIEIMRSRDERATLLLGDLNEWRLGDRSALRELGPAFGALPMPVPSFPSGLPLLALDRIIADRPEILSDVAVHDTPLARVASDHLPIKAFVDPSLTELAVPNLDPESLPLGRSPQAQNGTPARDADAWPLPIPEPVPDSEQRNRELVRKAGDRLKRAVKRTLRRA
ncbi:Metal-dependent hydrolase, endonuclease/exonuclease/phosphatase family OS=Bosea thiooxidans OX=53254 GN=SAMN05660750_03791 PE=4 SV=1 [Bosea thiooxidans]|uniref:Metal-dependent hydrolase, endonuclease/exonuclease/phosphatase family n=1 Tax=Bosea thiooxidans TaxID=53254 RepID=A0A1T5G5P3_9HYPH|nr:Metal-dependent hydrolase, endonuclease/exonuclease/phosphatase family [Bosea thiooxidans]